MEDLLPILIVIAISLIGAVGRKKRKRKPFENINQENKESNKSDSTVFDWLEKLSVEEEDPYRNDEIEPQTVAVEPIVEEKPKAEQHKVQEKYKSKYEHYTGFVTQSEKEKLVKKERDLKFRSKENSLAKDLKIEKSKRVRKKKKFDLRQAVIHNVVLNRKY